MYQILFQQYHEILKLDQNIINILNVMTLDVLHNNIIHISWNMQLLSHGAKCYMGNIFLVSHISHLPSH